jgi:hypothetical protein
VPSSEKDRSSSFGGIVSLTITREGCRLLCSARGVRVQRKMRMRHRQAGLSRDQHLLCAHRYE